MGTIQELNFLSSIAIYAKRNHLVKAVAMRAAMADGELGALEKSERPHRPRSNCPDHRPISEVDLAPWRRAGSERTSAL